MELIFNWMWVIKKGDKVTIICIIDAFFFLFFFLYDIILTFYVHSMIIVSLLLIFGIIGIRTPNIVF